MSKAIIASDIHGNIEYTKKLEELIIKEKPDYIILLGDLLSYKTKEVCNILNKYSSIIYAVKGNNDLLVNQELLNFNCLQEYIKLTIDKLPFFITHGHRLYKYYQESKNCYILSGHTHIYNIHGSNLNPGSVGRPRMNKEHTCILYHNHKIHLINLDNLKIMESRDLNEK